MTTSTFLATARIAHANTLERHNRDDAQVCDKAMHALARILVARHGQVRMDDLNAAVHVMKAKRTAESTVTIGLEGATIHAAKDEYERWSFTTAGPDRRQRPFSTLEELGAALEGHELRAY